MRRTLLERPFQQSSFILLNCTTAILRNCTDTKGSVTIGLRFGRIKYTPERDLARHFIGGPSAAGYRRNSLISPRVFGIISALQVKVQGNARALSSMLLKATA